MAWNGLAGVVAAMVVCASLIQAPAARQESLPRDAIAQAPPDSGPMVAARQETMRRMEAVWLLLSDMLRREDSLDRPVAVQGADILAGLFNEMQRQYPEGSFSPPSQALPDVRANWAAFTELAEDAERRARFLAQVVASGTMDEALDALSAVEQDCAACHLRFSPGIRSDVRPLRRGQP